MNLEILWPCICVFGGIGILVFGIAIRIKLRASQSWPQTTGHILESSTQSEWVGAAGERIYVEEPNVVYEYEVNGKKFKSSRLALIEMNTADAELARKKASRYSVGQQVSVYYNPRKPEFATLRTGDPTNGVVPILIIVAGIVAAIVGMVWLLACSK